MKKDNSKKIFFKADNLNMIVAVCAILVSLASFYATFLQADAAEKQVRAMTLPLITFKHDNYDLALDKRVIAFTLQNAGVGPAIIHSVELVYNDRKYTSITDFFKACCGTEYEAYEDRVANSDLQEMSVEDGGMATDSLRDIIVAGQSDYLFTQLHYGDINSSFWDKLDQERRRLSLEVCYCTLLGDCFKSQDRNVITEIKSCSVN